MSVTQTTGSEARVDALSDEKYFTVSYVSSLALYAQFYVKIQKYLQIYTCLACRLKGQRLGWTHCQVKSISPSYMCPP